MRSVDQATQAAEARKAACMGPADGSPLQSFNDFGRRAMLSGFDTDPDELRDFANRVGFFFCTQTPTVPLQVLFGSAWMDGVLVGLLLAQQSPSPNPPPPDDMGTFGGGTLSHDD